MVEQDGGCAWCTQGQRRDRAGILERSFQNISMGGMNVCAKLCHVVHMMRGLGTCCQDRRERERERDDRNALQKQKNVRGNE